MVAGAIAAGVVGAVVAVPLVSVTWSVHTALRDARRTAGGTTAESTAADDG